MKHLKKISFVLILGLLGACENRLEDIQPRTAISPEAVASVDDLERLLIGIYDGTQGGGTLINGDTRVSFNYLMYLTEDLSADNLTYRATFFQHGEINDNAILPENVLVQRYYLLPYYAIYRCNELLEIIERFAAEDFATPTRRAEIIGEVAYHRAYNYYRLVTLFGDVPLVTTNTVDAVPRDPADAVYAQIITDLETAIGNAPDFNNRSFVSKDAARALLARVALIRGDNQRAFDLSEELITSGRFALAQDYRSIFDGGAGVSEIIFQIRFTLTEGQASHGFFLLDQGDFNPFGTGGRLELPVDASLLSAYEEGDVRREASTAPARPGFTQVTKYPSGGNANDPMYISRIAEMYLTSAEARAKLTNGADGIGRLNEVRRTRGLGDLPQPGSLDEFIDVVLQERRVELAFESIRFTDLRRTGRAIDLLPNVTSENQLLYPIPTSERDKNPNLTQNPGYGG